MEHSFVTHIGPEKIRRRTSLRFQNYTSAGSRSTTSRDIDRKSLPNNNEQLQLQSRRSAFFPSCLAIPLLYDTTATAEKDSSMVIVNVCNRSFIIPNGVSVRPTAITKHPAQDVTPTNPNSISINKHSM